MQLKSLKIRFTALALASLATTLPACDEVANDPSLEANLATTVGYFVGAYDPASFELVQEQTHDVLTNGAVADEIDCTGFAFGAPPAFARVAHYKASRLQDGSCLAKADLFVSLPPTPGTSQSSASELTRRSDPEAGICPVTSFGIGGVQLKTWVENGSIRVEAPGCTTTPGTTCSMAVAGNCTGDVSQF